MHSGNFKALAAADVLAHHHIVATDHVRLRFGKLGPVTLVGSAGELLLLGPYQPCQFVLAGLAAVRTRKRVCFLGFFFVEKIALVHLTLLSTTEGIGSTEKCGEAVNWLEDEEKYPAEVQRSPIDQSLVHCQHHILAVGYAT